MKLLINPVPAAHRVIRRPPIRALILAVVDGGAWFAAIFVSAAARWGFEYSQIYVRGLFTAVTVAVGAQLVWGLLVGLYPGRRKLGSLISIGLLGISAVLIGAGLFVWVLETSGLRPVPLSVAVAAPGLFFIFATAPRLLLRAWRETRMVSRHSRSRRAIFFGAGEAGEEAVRALSRDPSSDIWPVAFLDDDPAHRRLRIAKCRVVGGRHELAAAAAQFGADTLVITMPSAPRADVRAVVGLARKVGLDVSILPRVAQSLNGPSIPGAIRPIQVDDFLGRDPVHLDVDAMRRFIQGRRVLVTGAGGSIGSELCAAITRLSPADLTLLDRDENALHAVQLRLEGRALLESERLVVADIRDSAAIRQVFEQRRPQVVFHTAALKHVTFLERFPLEAVKSNVFGTLNLLEASREYGVERFVNISTDKAADPINVLGYTKRVAEMLTSGFSGTSALDAVSVRFGNVLGSSGSVITIIRHQVLNGGPITITDPEVTRFFMTVGEAVQLVILAGALGNRCEVLVLDMGTPVRILDLARDLIAQLQPDGDLDIEFTGLRPGEKLHEVLTDPDETLLRLPHEAISSFAVPPLDRSRVTGWADMGPTEVVGALRSVALESGVSVPVVTDKEDEQDDVV